jgi:hypothetical protein
MVREPRARVLEAHVSGQTDFGRTLPTEEYG